MITQLPASQVLTASREQLGLAPSSALDDTLLAGILRRAASIHCPCSLSTLTAAVKESLAYLAGDSSDLEEGIDVAAEGLIVVGDLLELSQVTVDDPNAKGTWVFSAPPGFIVRPGGSIFIIGIVPDETTPLPASLSGRLEYDGLSRVIVPGQGEDLPSILRELGLREIPASAWLKAPKTESAAQLFQNMARRLSGQPPSGAIADMSILLSDRPVDYYSRRWGVPGNHTGEFVARRPQAYGEALWGLVHLKLGEVTRFLDFPLKGTRWRGCDVAWHVQMAIDQSRGTPQKYRRRTGAGGTYFDFFSPIPLWAQRRLCVVGRSAPPERCLLSYWVPEREAVAEEDYLQKHLWLTATGS